MLNVHLHRQQAGIMKLLSYFSSDETQLPGNCHLKHSCSCSVLEKHSSLWNGRNRKRNNLYLKIKKKKKVVASDSFHGRESQTQKLFSELSVKKKIKKITSSPKRITVRFNHISKPARPKQLATQIAVMFPVKLTVRFSLSVWHIYSWKFLICFYECNHLNVPFPI